MAITADDHYFYVAMKQQGGYGAGYPPSGYYWWGIAIYKKPTVNSSTTDSSVSIEPELWKGGVGWQSVYYAAGTGPILLVNNSTLSSSPLVGLAVSGGIIYVADTSTNTIRLYNATTRSQTPITVWRVTSPGQLAADKYGKHVLRRTITNNNHNNILGYIWMMQSDRRLVRYSPQGVLQSQQMLNFESGVSGKAFAIDLIKDRILVSDNGTNQNVRIYTNIYTTPIFNATFGATGGIFSGKPGQVAPLKFNSPLGIGIDKNSNIYVYSASHGFNHGGIWESYHGKL
jgi:hypothetical protein